MTNSSQPKSKPLANPVEWSPETRLVHGGTMRSQFAETSEALFLTQGYVYDSPEQAEERFKTESGGFIYSRYANPTVAMFEDRMKLLEGAEAARATASGMAAVSASLMCFLKAGDHVVAAKALFGSCLYVVQDLLPKFGIQSTLIDGRDIDAWKKAVRPNTKAFFFETPSNPCLDLVDIKAVSEIAKSHPFDVEPTVTASFAVVVFTPDAVTLRLLLKDGSPACDLASHPVPEIGPMTVWTCDGTDVVRPWDLEATVDGQTVVAEVPMMPPFPDGPLPNIGDRIPELPSGDWLTNWASDVMTRFGALIPVGRDGVVIGYIEAFTAPSLTPPSEDDPSSIIYDGNATRIGRFVNGVPVPFPG